MLNLYANGSVFSNLLQISNLLKGGSPITGNRICNKAL